MKLFEVGFGNYVSNDRVVAIVSTDSLPIRRMIQDAKDSGRAIDTTCGKKTLSVVITDSDHLVLSPEEAAELMRRFGE